MFNKILDKFKEIILDSERRDLFLHRGLYISFGILGFIIGIDNIVAGTDKPLNYSLIFAVLCIFKLFFSYFGPIWQKIMAFLLKVETILFLTILFVSGTLNGFVTLWIPLLPACGFLFFGLRSGFIINGIMFVIIIFLCWIPTGQNLLQYDYGSTFLMRYPILYFCYIVVGIIIGGAFIYTQRAYYRLATHDQMTGAFNRSGFSEQVYDAILKSTANSFGFMILDLDLFKNVNDIHGHFVGDEILCRSMELIRKNLSDCLVCRWGGEEFAVFVTEGDKTKDLAEKVCLAFSENVFVTKGGVDIKQTICVGAIEVERNKMFSLDSLALEADKCLYQAKNEGRNKAIFKKLD